MNFIIIIVSLIIIIDIIEIIENLKLIWEIIGIFVIYRFNINYIILFYKIFKFMFIIKNLKK